MNFDGAIILSYLSRTDSYQYKTFLRSMSFYKIEIIFKNKTISFLCSYKLLPLSLSKISLSFTDLKKMPFPYNFAKIENLFYCGPVPDLFYWNNKSDYTEYSLLNKDFDFKKYSLEYCINDVKITHLFLEKLNKILFVFGVDVSTVYSGPSLSLKIFLKCFNEKRVSFSNSKLYDKIARKAYYGGRCEVYANPYDDDFVFHYDFTGMYAQCMQEKVGFGKYSIKNCGFNIDIPGFYWIVFKSDLERPVLPIHDVQDNYKLIFPNGDNLSGLYWFEEIKFFQEKGGVVLDILYSLEYQSFDFVFSSYVNFFSQLRDKGVAYSSFGKNMNNFLYGRLGLKEPDEHSFFILKSELDYYVN